MDTYLILSKREGQVHKLQLLTNSRRREEANYYLELTKAVIPFMFSYPVLNHYLNNTHQFSLNHESSLLTRTEFCSCITSGLSE